MRTLILGLAVGLTTAISAATVNVVDFGADPTGVKPSQAEIRRAIDSAKKGDVIFFPQGRYLLQKPIWVGDRRQMVLRGEPGTVLCMHCNPTGSEQESSGGFQLCLCEDLKIENFTFTTDNPIGCIGVAVATDPKAHTLDLRIGGDFPIDTRVHFFQLNTYDEEGTPDGALETHQGIAERKLADGSRAFVGLDYRMIGPRTARITLPKWASVASVTNGHRILVRYFRNGAPPLHIQNCRRITVENFEVERAPSTGCVVAPPAADLTFRRFAIRPRADDPNVFASNADGIHFNACSGAVVFEDCHFVGLGDDAINVHCMGGEVGSYDPATGEIVLVARGTQRAPDHRVQTIYSNWAEVGDEVEFYDQRTLQLKGKARLREYVWDGPQRGRGVLEKGGYQPQAGELAANGGRFPSVRISNCTFRNTRARAVLLQSRNLLVENCRFYGLRSSALLLACDAVFWNEMGPVANAEVRNCHFEKCSRAWSNRPSYQGALAVKGRHEQVAADYPAGVHRNIRICDNSFENIGCCPIYVEATDGLQIRGNQFHRCMTDADFVRHPAASPVVLHNCTNTQVEVRSPIK